MNLPQKLKELQAVCEQYDSALKRLVDGYTKSNATPESCNAIGRIYEPLRDKYHDTFDPPTVARLLETIRIQHEALEFSKSGCLVPPDGGSPDVQDHINNASKALARVEKLWASGEAGELTPPPRPEPASQDDEGECEQYMAPMWPEITPFMLEGKMRISAVRDLIKGAFVKGRRTCTCRTKKI